MRILVLNYEFPPVGGGGGVGSENICRELAKKGHEVRVQTAHSDLLANYEQRDGYEIFRTFSFRTRRDRCSIPQMFGYLLTNWYPVLCHIRTWRPDVLHVHFAVPTGVLGWLAWKLTGTPYVLTIWGGDVPGFVPQDTGKVFRFIYPITKAIWKGASIIVSPSSGFSYLAHQSYNVYIDVVLGGVSLKQSDFSVVKREDDTVRILFVGRLAEQKNVSLLLRSVSKLKADNWSLRILGDGPLKFELRQQVDVLDITKRVSFEGWLPSYNVQEFMRESDILAVPSNAESLSFVTLEGMANGLAIVSTSTHGPSELVEDGINGLLVPIGDQGRFTEALDTLIACPELLAGMKSRSRTKAELFSWERVSENYESILQEVVTKRC